MNPFDASILSFLNGLARRSWAFDTAVVVVAESNLLKGGCLMALFFWAWFRSGGPEGPGSQERSREILLATLAGALVAITLARLLIVALPHRPRPVDEPGLHLVAPHSAGGSWAGESSFPSDHATLFCELATGLLLVSRRLGAGALTFVAVVICLPRLYLGLHYPTDVLAGSALGAGVAAVMNAAPIRTFIGGLGRSWRARRPGLFHAALFALAFEIATLFTDLRAIGGLVSTVAARHLGPGR